MLAAEKKLLGSDNEKKKESSSRNFPLLKMFREFNHWGISEPWTRSMNMLGIAAYG
jgi:hypothetical protein